MPLCRIFALLAAFGVHAIGNAQISSWSSPTSGFWNDATKWSAGVPTATTAAQITASGLTITVSSLGSAIFNARTLHSNSLLRILNSNTLTLSETISGTGRFDVYGELRVRGGFVGPAADVNLFDNGKLTLGLNTSSAVSHSGNIYADATGGTLEGTGTVTLLSASQLTGAFSRIAAFNLTNNGRIDQTGGALRIENLTNNGTVTSNATGSISLIANTGLIRVDGPGTSLFITGTHTGAQLGGMIQATNGAAIGYSGDLTLTGNYGFDAFSPDVWIGGTIRGGNLTNSAARRFNATSFRDNTTFDTGLNLDGNTVSFRYAPNFGSSGVYVKNNSSMSVVGSGTITAGLIDIRNGSRMSVSGTATLDANINVVDSYLVGGTLNLAAGRTIDVTRSNLSASSTSINNGTIRMMECTTSLPAFTNNGLIEILSGSVVGTNMVSNPGTVRVSGTGTEMTFREQVSTSFIQNVQVDTNGLAIFRRVQLSGGSFDHRLLGAGRKYNGFENGTVLGSSSLPYLAQGSLSMSDVSLDEGLNLNSVSFQIGNLTAPGDIVLNNCIASFNNLGPVIFTAPNLILTQHQSAITLPLSTVTLNTNLRMTDSMWQLSGTTTTLTAGHTARLSDSTWGRASSSESLVLNMQGTLAGDGNVIADARIEGSLAPGEASAAGELRFLGGKLTLQPGSTTEIDVFSDTQFDHLDLVGGQVAQLGGTLRVKLAPGGAISPNQRYEILTSTAGFSGQFSGLDLPSGWTVEYVGNRVNVVAVPEPGTMAAIGLGLVGLVRSRRKK